MILKHFNIIKYILILKMKYFINLILIRSVSIMIGSKYQNKKWRNEQKWYKNGKSNECETF